MTATRRQSGACTAGPAARGSMRSATGGLSLITERALERGGSSDVHVDGHGTTMRIRLVPEFESDWQLARRALERSLRA